MKSVTKIFNNTKHGALALGWHLSRCLIKWRPYGTSRYLGRFVKFGRELVKEERSNLCHDTGRLCDAHECSI